MKRTCNYLRARGRCTQHARRHRRTCGGLFHFTVFPLGSGEHTGSGGLPLELINAAVAGHAPHDGGAVHVTGLTLQSNDAFNLCVCPALVSVRVYEPQVFPPQVFLRRGEEFTQADRLSFP